MTRKDYVALAEALHKAHPGNSLADMFDRGKVRSWVDCTQNVADVLAADNPRFDRERFLKACQGEKS